MLYSYILVLSVFTSVTRCSEPGFSSVRDFADGSTDSANAGELISSFEQFEMSERPTVHRNCKNYRRVDQPSSRSRSRSRSRDRESNIRTYSYDVSTSPRELRSSPREDTSELIRSIRTSDERRSSPEARGDPSAYRDYRSTRSYGLDIRYTPNWAKNERDKIQHEYRQSIPPRLSTSMASLDLMDMHGT